MTTINIPGSAGTAMALAAAVSIFSASQTSEFKDYRLTGAFIAMTGVFIFAVYVIEFMHIKKDIKIKKIETSIPIEMKKSEHPPDAQK